MNNNRILVADDEHLISSMLCFRLEKAGYVVETAASGGEALQKFHDFKPELVILDLYLPDAFGLDLLATMREDDVNLPFIVITASSFADLAVKAFKLGAVNFFGKPFNVEKVVQGVTQSLKEKQKKDVESIAMERRKKTTPDQMIGNSPKMVDVFRLVNVCASTDAKTVLITGESGTGKELVARAVHQYSARAGATFVEVNCAAIPENLIENELFGHERGAYTDASKMQKGIFELANGGTIFLDEIGDMPTTMQTKLLKVMETKRFRRLGGEGEVETDVRIIAATNQDLPQLVADGRFRGDLYYRLNMLNICIPPLRERIEDIPALVQYFIQSLNAEYSKRVELVSSEALEDLRSYSWPGNVRELRNVIERAMMLEKGKELTHFHLCKETPRNQQSLELPPSNYTVFPVDDRHCFAGFQLPPEGISFEEVEKQLITLALENANGNQSKAAKSLKMSRDTLRYRLKKFGISEYADQTSCSVLKDDVPSDLKRERYNDPKWANC
ncbi:sigma-54-dependent Fis family transcriptional regulator [Oryzomonas sagensis]|uniref:Sigma-54-dependent Fis family transcriptional regulator n=1 Tax=Oryzomonas sagensis TaxID=2603857 RepID=A0ABQ6TLB7_9BACT|nr:sigma-54 dependent transcriptional regulator [Oryzomonas sagensis]KAB0669067.1 sigma-54-dependent Fis family transcriptional regulator [Oryzomonas sagensis]